MADAYHAQDASLSEHQQEWRLQASRYASGHRLLVHAHFPEMKRLYDRLGGPEKAVKAEVPPARYEANGRLPVTDQARTLRGTYAAIPNRLNPYNVSPATWWRAVADAIRKGDTAGLWPRVRLALREGVGVAPERPEPPQPTPAQPTTRKMLAVNDSKRPTSEALPRDVLRDRPQLMIS